MWASTRKRNLAAEYLERRALLAGDVSVDVINGHLIIQGDEEDNSILVAAGAEAGAYVLTGLTTTGGDTTFNGTTDTSLEVSDVTGDVVVRLRGGDDTFAAGGLTVADDLKISTGQGDDTVTLSADLEIEGKLSVETGGGDDLVNATGLTLAHSAQIDTGNGNDTVSLTDLAIGEADEEADALTARSENGPFGRVGGVLQNLFGGGLGRFGRGGFGGNGAAEGSVHVDLGNGDDALNVAGMTATTIKVEGGNGDDTSTLSGLTVDRIYANLGRGDDSMAVDTTTAEYLTALLGDGDDELSLASTTNVSELLWIEGGRGSDDLIDDLVANQPLDLIRRGFETIA